MVAKIDSPITPLEQTEKTNEIIDDLDDKLYRGEFNGVRSNCITDIPQDIKLELNAGTLTLKAGSKVYVPNGFEQDGTTPKFDEVTIENDITAQGVGTTTFQSLVFYYPGDGTLKYFKVADCSSGSSYSSSDYVWYDTTNNLVKRISSGSVSYSGLCLPICLITTTTGTFTSLDQVLNGFGFIGSTVFALPGVKGLIPDGRNSDGTLKSIEYTVISVLTSTLPSDMNTPRCFVLTSSGTIIRSVSYSVTKDNYLIKDDNGEVLSGFEFCNAPKITSGKIEIFTSKTVFHALDWNDKGTIAGWGMPSSKYIDLTLGASGTSYTAPSSGYFVVSKRSNAAGQYIAIGNGTIGYEENYSSISAQVIPLRIGVKKGDVVTVYYNVGGVTERFSFVYAEGEVNV